MALIVNPGEFPPMRYSTSCPNTGKSAAHSSGAKNALNAVAKLFLLPCAIPRRKLAGLSGECAGFDPRLRRWSREQN
jgi:hypothetical protein